MKEKNEPNSRNAAMSAATMVLFRSMAPGSRGALDRDSTRTNVASSRSAAANSPSVLADVQPWSTPRLSPYTSSSRPPVTAVAPSASNRREATSGRSAGRNRAARAMRAIPMGTLMKNTQRQPGPSVSRPLAITPIDAEVPATAPKIPRAQFRSRPSEKVTARIESAVGATSAAPNPWSARAPINSSCDWARPARSEAPENNASPVRKIRRLPSRSPSRPPRSRNPPRSRPYAITTHCSVL